MRCSITFLLALSLLGYSSSFSQEPAQMKRWYFNGKQIEFTETAAVVQDISTSHQYSASCANGVYDEQGEVLFNVIDGSVYNKEGGIIDYITDSDPNFTIDEVSPQPDLFQLGFETNVVNVPGECSKFYIIYSNFQIRYLEDDPPFVTPTGMIDQLFYYSVLDMELNDGLGGIAPGQKDILIDIPTDAPDNLWGMAVSSLKTNNTRNLYIAGGGGGTDYDKVYKLVIDQFGIDSPQLLFEANFDSGTFEVELSPDESMLAFTTLKIGSLGAGNNDLVILHLNSSGTIDESQGTNGVTLMDFPYGPVNQKYTGVEFSSNSEKVFVGGQGIGIFYYDFIEEQYGVVADDNEIGNSQLEMGYDGLIYTAISSSELRRIDPVNNSVVAQDVDLVEDAIILNHNASRLAGTF